MFKTDAIILLGLALNLILIAVMAFALKSLTASINALVQEKAAVSMETAREPIERATASLERVMEKPISTGNVSPKLIAVISGAIAAYLDDQDLERHSISAIQLADPQH